MDTILVTIFAMAYAAIALEHPLKVNKSASALLGAGLLWTVYAVQGNSDVAGEELSESLSQIAQIIFFLMGAMTIVEVIDAHNGFALVTSRIRTTKLARLLWIVGLLTFFLSAVLDNLTTTIIMVSLIKKLLRDRADRLFFAGIIVIAANAGGAWSPIGDVTTTMLWIGGQITASQIIGGIFVPALFNLLVPLAVTSWALRGRLVIPPEARTEVSNGWNTTPFEQNTIFFMGIAALLTVPVFKAVTHLPPFMGVLLNLGILWLAGELIHRRKSDDEKEHLVLAKALQRIDMPSIVFFLGILLAVSVLEHSHILASLASRLDASIGRLDVVVILIGIASAVVDNVPLVAAAMGMYPLAVHPTDSFLWEFLAYAAGTGGSILIIGSAAGVAAMGLERIDFFWYAKTIGGLALLGYIAGTGVYLLQYDFLH
jgi:Na+/H+ antiporter NhaD/arsenite permease-like protein